MNGGGCCTRAHALPPQGAEAEATDDGSSDPQVMLSTFGTATAKKRPTREAKKQRHHGDLQVLVLGEKRKYEDDESDYERGCRENDKMFKCNYWEDPAHAKRLQCDGLERARIAALDNQIERLLKFLEFDEPPAPDAPQQPPEPAGASDAPILSGWDRIRQFDLDYW